MKVLRQVMAIARTEFRFGLRRGWPVVGTAAVGLVVSASTLWLAFMNMEGFSRKYAADTGARALAMIWPAFPMLVLGVLPIVTAPAIPADRQLGVDELLRSLPLTGGVYLLGKVCGTLAAVLLTGVVALMLHLGVHWVLLGPINASLYLELMLLSGLPLLSWASTMGVVTACGMRTRRNAILVGLAMWLLGPLAWGLFAPPPSPMFVALNPFAAWGNQVVTHQPMSDFVFARYDLLNPLYSAPMAWHVVLSLLTALLVVLAAVGLARLWLLQKENF